MSESQKQQQPVQQTSQPPVDDEGEKLVLNSPEEAKTARDFVLWAGVIVLAVMSVFSPAMHGGFLWDDDRHVEANRGLRDGEGLANIWTGHWAYFFADETDRPRKVPYTPQYYPVTHTSYWIEAQALKAFDQPITPTLFHVTNMLLHAAGAILLWFLLRELGVPGAWMAAAVFALHPVQAESVAWISERKNVLAGALFFASVWAYVRVVGIGTRGPGWPFKEVQPRDQSPQSPDPTLYFVSLGLFILAVLSKTVACSMPAVMLLLIWWKRGSVRWKQDVVPLLPFFAFGLVMGLFTGWIERSLVGAQGEEWQLSFVQHVLLAANVVWFYLGKLVAPLNLAFFYPQWDLSAASPRLWIGVIAFIAVPVLLFALRRRIGRGPLVAWLIFCGALVPAMGFFNVFPMRYSVVADHFQYLAAPAMIVLIVGTLTMALRRTASTASYAMAGLVLVVLAILSARHATIFASQAALWRDTAAKNPNQPSVRYNYGLTLFNDAGQLSIDRQSDIANMLAGAQREFEAAVALNPAHDRAWNAWGHVLLEKHEANQALAKFDTALKHNPNNLDAKMGRGMAFVQLKDWESALPAYEAALSEAIRQKRYTPLPKVARIYHMMGRVLDERGQRTDALVAYRQAVNISPGMPQVHYDFATLLVKAHAIASTQPTQPASGPATQPTTASPPSTTTSPATRPGPAPASREQITAAEQFAAAIGAAPDYVDARVGLASLMLDVGNLQGARVQLATATSLLQARTPQVETTPEYPRLVEVTRRFDAAYRQAESATRPATGPAGTQPAADPFAEALRALEGKKDANDRADTAPSTRTATPPTP